MSAGLYPTSASCAVRGFVEVAYLSVPGPPPGLNALSGTAPTSHMRVPFGCTTRKQGTDIIVVAISSFLSWYGETSGMARLPQSNTYKRTDFGGSGFRCCAVADSAAARSATMERRTILLFIIISCCGIIAANR